MAALQTINLGAQANDGTGDDLREAFEKVIFNFAELDSRSPEATTVTNLGNGEGIFANISNADIQLKSLKGGQNATLVPSASTITIDVDAGVTQFDVAGDSGSYTITEGGTVSVTGGTKVTTARDGNTIVVNTSAIETVSEDPAPQLGGTLNANGENIINVGSINASQITGPLTGNVTGLVNGVNINDLNLYRDPFSSWDFGTIGPITVNNIYDWFFTTNSVDFGSIQSPVNKNLNAGTINTPLI